MPPPKVFAKYISLLCELNFQTLRNCRGSSCSHFEIQTVMIAYFCKFLQPVCQTHPGGGGWYPPPSVIPLLLFYCFVVGRRCYGIIQRTLGATFSCQFSVLIHTVHNKKQKTYIFRLQKDGGITTFTPRYAVFLYVTYMCNISCYSALISEQTGVLGYTIC